MRVFEEEDTLKRPVPGALKADGGGGARPDISVFLPVFNEEPNLPPLHQKMRAALMEWGLTAEVIYVDYASSDASPAGLRAIAA